MSEAVMLVDGVPCRPNISPAGLRKRRVFGSWNVAAAGLLAAGLVLIHARWFWCLGVFLPAALAAIGFLQASRKTCVARAAEGTFERDDFSKTAAPDDDVGRSRKVSSGITRDSILIGVAAAALTIIVARWAL
jgi:hypothetical protein